MKSVLIHAYECVPAIEDVETPRVGAGKVLVRVAAASLNPLDVKLQKGFMRTFFTLAFPYTVGRRRLDCRPHRSDRRRRLRRVHYAAVLSREVA